MTRPALAVLLVSCLLLFGLAAVSGTVAGQDGTAERSLNTTTVAPGETVEVTVTADLDGPSSVDFADAWSPPVADSSVVSVSFDRAGLGVAGSEEVALFSDDEVTADSVEIVYTLTVPTDVEDGTVYEWDPTANGDGSFLSVGDDDRPIAGDQQFEVVADSGNNGGTDNGGDNDGDDGGTDNGGDDGGTDNGGDDGGTDNGGDDGGTDNGGDDGGTDNGGDDGGDGTGDDGGEDTTDGSDGTGGDTEDGDDGSGPGFGLAAVVLAVALLAVYSIRRG
jgi:hypothetical protein